MPLVAQGREKGGPANHNCNDGNFVDYCTESGIRTWAFSGYIDKKIGFDRVPLRPEMCPYFNFTTLIQTNLKGFGHVRLGGAAVLGIPAGASAAAMTTDGKQQRHHPKYSIWHGPRCAC